MHARDRHAQRRRREQQRRTEAAAGGEPQRQPRGCDRDDDAGDDERRRMREMRARVQRAHADVVHGDDAAAHERCGGGEPARGERAGAGEEYRRADDENADEKRQERRQYQIIDRDRQAGGQHADEMHRPDRDGERDGRAGQQQAPP